MEDNEMDGWVLAVGQKRTLSALAKEHFDLSTFPQDRRGQRYAGLPEPMLILSEIPEATSTLLNGTVSPFVYCSRHEGFESTWCSVETLGTKYMAH